MSEVLAFLGVAVLVIVTPGPDTAITIRGTLLGGRRAGLLTACGVVSGQACWTVAASAGVTALLVASEPAFLALKFAGAAYLVYLGGQALLAAVRGTTHEVRATGSFPARTAYRQGLISDLGNPKMAAFFTSLLPQFGTTFATMLAFGLLFCVLTWLWLALYATAIAKLRLGRVYRIIQGVTGAVLVALGVRLAAERG
jgi:threonine/homoserine/homoserine lactone efflux protein